MLQLKQMLHRGLWRIVPQHCLVLLTWSFSACALGEELATSPARWVLLITGAPASATDCSLAAS